MRVKILLSLLKAPCKSLVNLLIIQDKNFNKKCDKYKPTRILIYLIISK